MRLLLSVPVLLTILTPIFAAGDVTDVRVIRAVEQHPGAALLWEPYIAEWKAKHLVVAFGVGIAGKSDMGDICACVSTFQKVSRAA